MSLCSRHTSEGKEDGDYYKTMFRAMVGGREGVEGEEQAGTGIFMELLRSLDEGTCRRLSVVGRGEGRMPLTTLCRTGSGGRSWL